MSSIPPPLVSLIAQFESATAEANALAVSTTEATFTTRPPGNRWSAAECLSHLTTTNERYLRKLDRTIAAAPSPRRQPRYRPSLFGRLFKYSMEPPVRQRLRAPEIFVPPPEPITRDAALTEFVASQSRIIDAILSAAALDFTAVTLRSQVTRLLKLNLWDAFQIMAAHERRHLWQARKTVAEIDQKS